MPETAVTPDTTAYLFLALGLFFGVLVLFVASMSLRFRSLRKDEALIQELSDGQ
jgi:hypothetical protein